MPPSICVLTIICLARGGFGGRADKSSNGFGSLLCPSAGYGSTLCTWRRPPIFQNITFFKNCCNRRKCKSFFVLRQDSHAAWDRFPQNLVFYRDFHSNFINSIKDPKRFHDPWDKTLSHFSRVNYLICFPQLDLFDIHPSLLSPNTSPCGQPLRWEVKKVHFLTGVLDPGVVHQQREVWLAQITHDSFDLNLCIISDRSFLRHHELTIRFRYYSMNASKASHGHIETRHN